MNIYVSMRSRKEKQQEESVLGWGRVSHVNRGPRKAKLSFSPTWHHLASLIVQSGAFLMQKAGDGKSNELQVGQPPFHSL